MAVSSKNAAFRTFLRRWRGVLLLVVLLGGAGLLLHVAAPRSDLLASWLDARLPGGIAGGLCYIGATALLSCIAVPRQALSFAGGYTFGPLLGACLGTIGITIGCMLAFAGSRFFGRSFIERRYGEKAASFNQYVIHRPFSIAVLIRFFPSGNNLLFSILAGVSRISPLPFFLGSCVGYIPQNVLFALLGSGMRVDAGWQTGLGILLFAASCFLAWYLYKQAITGRSHAVYEKNIFEKG